MSVHASWTVFLACIDDVHHNFPDTADPNRYEALAHVFQLAAYRQMWHAETLRALHAATPKGTPAS